MQKKPRFLLGTGGTSKQEIERLANEATSPATSKNVPRFTTGQTISQQIPRRHEFYDSGGPGKDGHAAESPQSRHRFDRSHVAKRLKLDDEEVVSDAIDQFRQPVNKFITSPSVNDEEVVISRPAFLRSSSSSAVHDPLPEVFSPHRRGQRFSPGGMAAEVQSWIFDVGNVVSVRRGLDSGDMGRRHDKVFEVQAIRGSDVQLMTGLTRQGMCSEVLLVEKRDAVTGRLIMANVGDVVGVRDPTWPVELDKDQMLVAVDWQILR